MRPTSRNRAPVRRRPGGGGFTLAEVLAALLFMAIVVPVVLHGMSVASRAGVLGQRKAAAMRVGERVLNDLAITGEWNQGATGGNITEGDTTYAWTMQSATWPSDAMTQVSVQVTFTVQGNDYSVSISTLFDPATALAAASP